MSTYDVFKNYYADIPSSIIAPISAIPRIDKLEPSTSADFIVTSLKSGAVFRQEGARDKVYFLHNNCLFGLRYNKSRDTGSVKVFSENRKSCDFEKYGHEIIARWLKMYKIYLVQGVLSPVPVPKAILVASTSHVKSLKTGEEE